MATNDITSRKGIKDTLDAVDALNHAHSMLTFLQDVLTLHPNGDTLPESVSSTGLYYIMQDIKDRVLDANVILGKNVMSNKGEIVPIKA